MASSLRQRLQTCLTSRVCLVGIGNPDRGDDGFGVRLAEAVRTLGYPDVIAKCDELERKGYKIWPEDWRRIFPTGRRMAFLTDPDGYEVELLEEA